MNSAEELALVVPTKEVETLLCGDFSTHDLAGVVSFILGNYEFRPRSQVETDCSFKQVIPYVMVRYGDKHLLLRRKATQTEKRLHDKFSLGVGGHINPAASLGSHRNIIEASMHRELEEEVHVGGCHRISPLGVINDQSTEVSRVHLGLAMLLETDSPDFQVNEPDGMDAQWADKATLANAYERMEGWSKILVDHCLQ